MSLEGISKLELIRHFSNLSLPKIVEEQYPSIGNLTKAYGIEKTEKIIQVLLFDLSASFGDEMNDDQVLELSVEVTSNLLRNLSLEDVYLVCRQIKSSKNFGKLNVNKVLNAFEEHLSKRATAFYEYNRNQEPKVLTTNRDNKALKFKEVLTNTKKSK